VVAVGVTDLEVEPVTLMAPGSSLKPVASFTDHDKSDDCPLVGESIESGEAVNVSIEGRPGPLFAVANMLSPETD
jgi:hypothetical protein